MLHDAPRLFLARPFWRNYVVAFVLIGLGFEIIGIGASNRGDGRTLTMVSGYVTFVMGWVVFALAVGWSVWSAWHSRRSGGAT